jgi:hypothetical protein
MQESLPLSGSVVWKKTWSPLAEAPSQNASKAPLPPVET